MQGTILYPLNTLKGLLPDIYESQNKKYQGREFVQSKVVPGLGRWNDVIHLSPIDPSETRQALKEAGATPSPSWKVFCIDAGTLDASRMLIHVDTGSGASRQVVNLPFTEENYAKFHHLPDQTKEYYRQCVRDGKQVLLYVHAPHALYGGPIDISNVEIKEYSD